VAHEKRDVLLRWFDRVWRKQDAAAIDELFVPDGKAHGLGGQALVGPKEFRVFHEKFRQQMEDFDFSIDRSHEDGEWISVLCTMRARDRRSKRPVTMTGAAFARIRDGKIVEAYNHWDFMGLFGQLGTLPATAFAQCLEGKRAV
jgi:ketosteroid isomerase-like protein